MTAEMVERKIEEVSRYQRFAADNVRRISPIQWIRHYPIKRSGPVEAMGQGRAASSHCPSRSRAQCFTYQSLHEREGTPC